MHCCIGQPCQGLHDLGISVATSGTAYTLAIHKCIIQSYWQFCDLDSSVKTSSADCTLAVHWCTH